MAVHLTKGERVRLRHRPHFTGTVVARREGNVDVRWDADGCTATTRQWRLQRILEARDGHVFQEWGKWKGLCPVCHAEQPRGSKARRGAKAWVRRHDQEKHRVPIQRQTDGGVE